MDVKIQTENIQKALDEGYKVSQLWTLDTRTISSNEKLNNKGSYMKGTVYVDWAFWLDSNIETHAFVAVLDNGTELSQASFEDLKASLGIKKSPVLTQGGTQFDVEMNGWDSEDQSSTVGLLGLYLIYLDNDNWIKVYDSTTHSTASMHTFPVHKGRDFKILIQEAFEYETATFNLDGPIPTFKKHLRADFKGAELDIFMPTEVTCTVKIINRNLDKLWIKYI